MSIGHSYEEVLGDLEARRQRCADELKMLDGMISNLRQFITLQHPQPNSGVLPLQPRPFTAHNPALASSGGIPDSSGEKKYFNMSVRWAILYLLADASEPMGRAEIAEALSAGGITSNALSFASNVSAVLSVMAKERDEVEQMESGFRITAHGREVWEGIKRTPQWASRAALLAS